MTQLTSDDLRDRTLLDRDGDKIGKIEHLYAEGDSGQPQWALVQSGLLHSRRTFVPLSGAQVDGEDVRVPLEKTQVKDAPHIEADSEISTAEEQQLFEHYGMQSGSGAAMGTGSAGTADATSGRDVSEPQTDDAMTRSEEELRVGTERFERGRVRLRKVVVTEQVQTTIPVQREEVRVEREPITDANVDAATDGPAISDEEHEVVLHEERPVVEKRVVPKERVRLGTETVSEEREVTDEVRRERIETDGPQDRER
jgi:uncharacterized protein (TIGR02271 family)